MADLDLLVHKVNGDHKEREAYLEVLENVGLLDHRENVESEVLLDLLVNLVSQGPSDHQARLVRLDKGESVGRLVFLEEQDHQDHQGHLDRLEDQALLERLGREESEVQLVRAVSVAQLDHLGVEERQDLLVDQAQLEQEAKPVKEEHQDKQVLISD